MKQQTRIAVFDEEQYDGEWPPEDAAECVAWFAGKLEAVPAEHRATARIEIDSAGGYEGSHYGRIKIYYIRQETDEETASREKEEQRRQQAQKEHELRTLAELKAKYGA